MVRKKREKCLVCGKQLEMVDGNDMQRHLLSEHPHKVAEVIDPSKRMHDPVLRWIGKFIPAQLATLPQPPHKMGTKRKRSPLSRVLGEEEEGDGEMSAKRQRRQSRTSSTNSISSRDRSETPKLQICLDETEDTPEPREVNEPKEIHHSMEQKEFRQSKEKEIRQSKEKEIRQSKEKEIRQSKEKEIRQSKEKEIRQSKEKKIRQSKEKEIRQSKEKEIRQSKEKEMKQLKDQKEMKQKEMKQSKEQEEMKPSKKSKQLKEVEHPKETRQKREVKPSKDVKTPIKLKVMKQSKELKMIKLLEDVKQVTELKQAEVTQGESALPFCLMCGVTVSSGNKNTWKRRHILQYHLGIIAYRCSHCSYTHQCNRDAAKKHTSRLHNGQKAHLIDDTVKYKQQFEALMRRCFNSVGRVSLKGYEGQENEGEEHGLRDGEEHGLRDGEEHGLRDGEEHGQERDGHDTRETRVVDAGTTPAQQLIQPDGAETVPLLWQVCGLCGKDLPESEFSSHALTQHRSLVRRQYKCSLCPSALFNNRQHARIHQTEGQKSAVLSRDVQAEYAKLLELCFGKKYAAKNTQVEKMSVTTEQQESRRVMEVKEMGTPRRKRRRTTDGSVDCGQCRHVVARVHKAMEQHVLRKHLHRPVYSCSQCPFTNSYRPWAVRMHIVWRQRDDDSHDRAIVVDNGQQFDTEYKHLFAKCFGFH